MFGYIREKDVQRIVDVAVKDGVKKFLRDMHWEDDAYDNWGLVRLFAGAADKFLGNAATKTGEEAREYVRSEGFIDSIIDRINRKQLGGK